MSTRPAPCSWTAPAPTTTEMAIERVPGRLGGVPVFRDTRIPVSTVWNLRDAGWSTQRILDNYPALTMAHIVSAELFRRPTWQQDVADTEAALRAGVAGESVGVDDLRRLLGIDDD